MSESSFVQQYLTPPSPIVNPSEAKGHLPLQLSEVLVLRDEGYVPVCGGGGHEGIGEFQLVV
jgi:hypothetical protein